MGYLLKKKIYRKGKVFERPCGVNGLISRLRYNPYAWDIYYRTDFPKNKFRRMRWIDGALR